MIQKLTTALAIVFIGFLPVLASAQEVADSTQTIPDAVPALSVLDQWQADPTLIFPADGLDLNQFVWQARPLVVFADSPQDPNFIRQLQLLTARIDDLAERDVIVIIDTDRANPSAMRTTLRPRGFMLVLLDKDGSVAFRKPAPWDVREISRSINKMPSRIQEVEDRRALGN